MRLLQCHRELLRRATTAAPLLSSNARRRVLLLPGSHKVGGFWDVGARREFQSGRGMWVVKPFILADIGEGIRECEVIQWFVEPEARVEQFDKLCEVQSDKASVDITSRYDGVVKKLHYRAGEMALVGKPLVDIDVVGEVEEATPSVETPAIADESTPTPASDLVASTIIDTPTKPSKHQSLATPAVRRICREHGIEVEDVTGTGKDGRVTKEDVMRYVENGGNLAAAAAAAETKATAPQKPTTPSPSSQQEETVVPLTPIQNQMFKTMTKSLTIPHFLYADEVILNSLDGLRINLNKNLALDSASDVQKLTYMPFIIKAVSLALNDFPLLNARVDADSGPKPAIVHRSHHNIGVAMDTPSGLIVPNIKNVASLSILDIAVELKRLQAAGSEGKLSPSDLSGGTITVSNIGNIGGGVVAPVIVPSEVSILGIGRAKTVPAFDEAGKVIPRSLVNFCWSADHRVVDGATMARMGALVKKYLESPEMMLAKLR